MFGGFKIFGSQNNNLETTIVKRDTITKKVQASGEVTLKNRIELSFKEGGEIEEILNKEGKSVQKGDPIVQIKNIDLQAAYLQANASYNKALANLQKVQEGATEEEVNVYESNLDLTKASMAQVESSLRKARVELENTKEEYDRNINLYKATGENEVKAALIDMQNALSDVDNIQREHFVTNDRESLRIRNLEQKMRNSIDDLESVSVLEERFGVAKESLSSFLDYLTEVREVCDKPAYRNKVSDTQKETLEAAKSTINTTLGSVVTSESNYLSALAGKEEKVRLLEASIDELEDSLESKKEEVEKRKRELIQVSRSPKDYEVMSVQADVDNAFAVLNRAENDLSEARLKAPCSGVVGKINVDPAEMVSKGEPVALMLCEGGYNVQVDVPETDIGMIEVGDKALVSVYAFPGQLYEGEVIEIEPAETILQGVVYYRIKINFDSPRNIKPGMTSDVDIVTETKEGVLVIPQIAIDQRPEGDYVRIREGRDFVERKIETGISDFEGNVEVTAGLKEGEEIVLYEND